MRRCEDVKMRRCFTEPSLLEEPCAQTLSGKIKRLSREGHGRDRVSLNYRSFMFGKLPPPAWPGLCYKEILIQ